MVGIVDLAYVLYLVFYYYNESNWRLPGCQF